MAAIEFEEMPSVSGHGGDDYLGHIAVSTDDRLIASVDPTMHSVYIYPLDAPDGSLRVEGSRRGRKRPRPLPHAVFGTGVPGRDTSSLNSPVGVCFVRRGGVETVLVTCLAGRLVEFGTDGSHVRDIHLTPGATTHVTYSSSLGVIAVVRVRTRMHVSSCAIEIIDYLSASVLHTIVECDVAPICDGDVERYRGMGTVCKCGWEGLTPLMNPSGISVTLDGQHVIVSNSYDNCVAMYRLSDGGFETHLVTSTHNGMGSTCSAAVMCRDDILVACGGRLGHTCIVVRDGRTLVTQDMFNPFCTAYSKKHGVLLKMRDGRVKRVVAYHLSL